MARCGIEFEGNVRSRAKARQLEEVAFHFRMARDEKQKYQKESIAADLGMETNLSWDPLGFCSNPVHPIANQKHSLH